MFKAGDKIVHPMHGAGVIDSVVEKKLNGVSRNYYVMKLPVDEMLVMIPTANTEQIGVRPVCGYDEAEELLCTINKIEVESSSNWNHRYRENMTRIKSGDLKEVAKVVKSLMTRNTEKALSTGERKMLGSAKQILISELVLSQSSSFEEIEERIDSAFA